MSKRVEQLQNQVQKIYKKLNTLIKKEEDEFIIEEKESALKGYLKSYFIIGKEGYGPHDFIDKIKNITIEFLENLEKPKKVTFVLTCEFIKRSPSIFNEGGRGLFYNSKK